MTVTRRRFLTIAAAAAAAYPHHALASGTARWTGTALGAHASMALSGVDDAEAARAFMAIEAELDRLEQIFSLYRRDSSLVQLNREGHLSSPPAELLELLALCDTIHNATDGAFDPTVQPLWTALANGSDTSSSRDNIGWDKVVYHTKAVRFLRGGMGITLNGIAQGYVTDRVAALLTSKGFSNILVDIGEIAAHGHSEKGQGWKAGIAMPKGRIVHRVTLSNRALATSAPAGFVLGRDRASHILGPRGQEPLHELVSVSAPSAAVADGMSTGICLLDTTAAQAAISRLRGARLEVLI